MNHPETDGRSTHPSEIQVRGATAVGLLLLVVVSLQSVATVYGQFPRFEVSTGFLVLIQLYLMKRYGLISIPSLFGALLVYPTVVPFVSTYVFEVPLFALRGQQFQTPEIVNKTVFMTALALSVMVVALELLHSLSRDTDTNRLTYTGYQVYFDKAGFAAVGIIFLVSSYLTTPGPTLLTVNYATVLNNYYSWATFAGALFMGSWIVLFLMCRREPLESRRYKLFFAITVIGISWLLLHSRRSESIGVLSLLVLDIVRNRVTISDVLNSPQKLVGTLTVMLFAATQVLIDSFRGGGVIGLPDYNQGTYASYPGGAHNIYGTFQATISLFTYDFPHRLGLTFVRYPAQSIPTGVLAVLDLPYLPLYGAFLGQQYETYLGGSYILNPYFADFGQVGIVLAGVVFAVVAHFAQQQLTGHYGNYVVTGIAAVVVVGSFRAFWYTQIAWVDTLQGFIAALIVYLVVVNGFSHQRGSAN